MRAPALFFLSLENDQNSLFSEYDTSICTELASDAWRQRRVLIGLLTSIEVTSLIFLDAYILGLNQAVSSLSPGDPLFPQIYVGSSLIALSAISLILGSCLIIRSAASIGGVVILVSGAVVPIPIYLYFAEFSEPTLLSWLGYFGLVLFAPGVIGGFLGIMITRQSRIETKNVEDPVA
jgi:hypothetical protein